jgi:hypothetical protein
MSWHFWWIIPLVMFWSFGFRRRAGYSLPRRPSKQRRRERSLERDPEVAGELESQRNYIAELEVRVAELENRLDFTERLLTARAEPAQNPG